MEALGFRIFVALLTTMMVWFGVQEALSSAQGGPGFNFASLCDFVVVASFAYTFIEFYGNAIPGVGYSFKDFITVGATGVANINRPRQDRTRCKSDDHRHAEPTRGRNCEGADEYLLRLNDGLRSASAGLLFGHHRGDRRLRSSRGGRHRILGPVFIPFLLVDKLSFLFWGWLRAFIGFSFYKVVAAAVLSVLGHLYQLYYMSLIPLDPVTLVTKLPLLMLLVLVNHLHSVQDSGNHRFDLLGPHWRPRRRLGSSRTRSSLHIARSGDQS